jgi:hypothetical protein
MTGSEQGSLDQQVSAAGQIFAPAKPAFNQQLKRGQVLMYPHKTLVPMLCVGMPL